MVVLRELLDQGVQLICQLHTRNQIKVEIIITDQTKGHMFDALLTLLCELQDIEKRYQNI